MTYVIEGLDPAPFAPLFALNAAALAERNIVELVAEDEDYPCRIALAGAPVGDRLLLVNHVHQPAASPYRSAHAIYVAESSRHAGYFVGTIPDVMQRRLLSVRAFNAEHMIIAADVVAGGAADGLVTAMLEDRRAAYLHVHFAKRGCFAATVRRAEGR